MKVVRMVPQVGKMWRRGWCHHPDVGVVVMGKTLRHWILMVHYFGGMVVVMVVRTRGCWWRELVISEDR
jgi:hypothetical protein